MRCRRPEYDDFRRSSGYLGLLATVRRLATHVYEFHLMLYTRRPGLRDESCPVAVAALIVLAGRLPGHAELSGDLRPSDPEANGVVDQRCKLRLCLLLRNPGVLDPRQDLRGGHPGSLLRLAGRLGERWPPVRLCLLGYWARPALGLAHTFQHAGHV